MNPVNVTVYIGNRDIYIGGVTGIVVAGEDTIYRTERGSTLTVRTAHVSAVLTTNA